MAKAVFKFNAVELQMAVRRRLREMPHLARAAMHDVGVMIEREAKLRVPVDTGMLTACIRHTIADSPRGAAGFFAPKTDLRHRGFIFHRLYQYRTTEKTDMYCSMPSFFAAGQTKRTNRKTPRKALPASREHTRITPW